MIDLERRLRAFDPGVRPPSLPETDVSYAVMDSPVGGLVLAASEAGLVACSYDDETITLERVARAVSPRILKSPQRLDEARRQLDAYFTGRRREFDLTVDLACATPFARVVLRSLSRVPYGATTTYAEVARRIRRPAASRAVGAALGTNPVCIVMPCHRVVRSDGDLGGYAGGVDIKRRLLGLEGVLAG